MPPFRLPIAASLAAASVLCPPGHAQQPSAGPLCGMAEVAWLGADAAGQDIATAPSPVTAEVGLGGGRPATLAFRSSAPSQPLRVEAGTASGDPAIRLLTEDGDLIAENDDTPVSLNARLETTLGPGVYCVSVRAVDDGDITATVQVSRPEQPALLDEDQPAGAGDAEPAAADIPPCLPDTPAQPLAEAPLDESLAQGPVTRTQDGTATGYYRFRLSQPSPVTLRASSPTLDASMRLFDAQGALLAENDDADDLNARLDFPVGLDAGDYCIGVLALSPEPGQLTVSAERLDPERFLRDAYRRGEANPPADGSFPVQSLDLGRQGQTVVLHDGATQWLGFDLDQPTVLIVSAYGSLAGADPRLVLFAASGALTGENDDVDGGTNARLGPVLLQPGRYHLGVVDVARNDGTTGPIRPVGLIFERFVPAQ